MKKSITDLVVEMARDNPIWGYTRIRGALFNLGNYIARNTIKNTLLEHGLEPAPERGKRTSWRIFLQTHLGSIAGADFFTVEVLTPFGLTRYTSSTTIQKGPTRDSGINSSSRYRQTRMRGRAPSDDARGLVAC